MKPTYSSGLKTPVSYERICIQQVEMKYYILTRIEKLQALIGQLNEGIYYDSEEADMELKSATAKEELDMQFRIFETLNQNEIEHGYKLIIVNEVMNS